VLVRVEVSMEVGGRRRGLGREGREAIFFPVRSRFYRRKMRDTDRKNSHFTNTFPPKMGPEVMVVCPCSIGVQEKR
jgi:hypothetical protein